MNAFEALRRPGMKVAAAAAAVLGLVALTLSAYANPSLIADLVVAFSLLCG